MENPRGSDDPIQNQASAVIEEIPDEPIAGSCFRWENGMMREFTPEEYTVTPRGHIFIGIGGFKPPAGKAYKPDPIRHASDLED